MKQGKGTAVLFLPGCSIRSETIRHLPEIESHVVSFTLGFYLLTTEFSLYIPFKRMILLHLSFLAQAVFLFVQIREGIKKEMQSLAQLIEIENDLRAAATDTPA